MKWRRGPAFSGLMVSLFAVAVPVAAWWKVGRQKDFVRRHVPPQRLLDPLPVSASTERLIGWAGVALVIAAVAGIAWTAVRGRLDFRWLGVMGGTAASGITLGWTYRMLSVYQIDGYMDQSFKLLGATALLCALVTPTVLAVIRILEGPEPAY